MNRSRELQYLGIRLQGALLAGGHFQLAAGGIPNQINFKRVYSDQHQPLAFYEVDLASLPMGIQPENLSKPDTIRFLARVIGRPIKTINGQQGLTYCITLAQ